MASYGQRILLLSVALLFGATPRTTSAQNKPSATSARNKPSATRIGPHRLGEGIKEWLAAENLNRLDQVCPVRRQEVKEACEGINSGLNKLVASVAEADESLKQDVAGTCPRETSAAGEACDLEMSKIASGERGAILSLRGDKEYKWEFANGDLAELLITTPSNQLAKELARRSIGYAAKDLFRDIYEAPGADRLEATDRAYQVRIDALEPAEQLAPKDSDTAREIKFLTEVYGPPSATREVAFQNSYGAKWECPEVTWARPDGASVVLDEYIRNTDSGARKGVHILFVSRDALKSLKNDEKPNPYK